MSVMSLPTLRLFNTYAGHKEPFVPADPARVTMYVCGPTVYARAHIGNARPPVVFDVLYRILRMVYGEGAVRYARNFTDIDDNIILAAKEAGVDIEMITEKYAEAYQEDTAALGVLAPDIEPRATAHMGEIQDLISRLLVRGHAYVAQGHVLFNIESFPDYGRLSRLDREAMIAGARVEVAPYKRDAADFVLWKPSADDEPGWAVPTDWGVEGKGRPGWHLECSAMIEATLGPTIDIHGGGQDLRFPHHENEIAQSCCAGELGDVPLARYWLHNGFLNMGADKMSKSLGNIITPRELLADWDGEVLRWALLSAHYRQPLEWTNKLLEQSKRQLDRFYRVLSEYGDGILPAQDVPQEVFGPLCDDLNTPEAMAGLHGLREAVVQAEAIARPQAVARLLAGGAILGVLQKPAAAWLKGFVRAGGLSEASIEALLVERAAAKAGKNYARADEIRAQLAEEKIVIEDGPAGASWRRG